MPDVKQIAHDHADKLIVLGITVTDKEEAVQRFLKDRLFRTRSYTALPGRAICYRRTAFRMLMANHAPVSVLIRPGGEVVYVQDGASEKHPFLSEEINAALQQAR